MVFGSVPDVCPLVTLRAESGFGVWGVKVIHCGCSEMRHPWRGLVKSQRTKTLFQLRLDAVPTNPFQPVRYQKFPIQ